MKAHACRGSARTATCCPLPASWAGRSRVLAPLHLQPRVSIVGISDQQQASRNNVSSRCSTSAAASSASAPAPSPLGSGPSDLQAMINAIPFRRLAIWGLIAALAYQLHDFAGVSLSFPTPCAFGAPCALVFWRITGICLPLPTPLLQQMVLGTFIVSFIGNSFVEGAQESPMVRSLLPTPTVRRQVLVLLYFLMILGLFTLLGVLTIPDIAREGADFMNRLQSDNIWVILVEKMRRGVG